MPLTRGSEPIGELVVGVRSGSRRLSAADREVLALLATPVAMAVHATLLADELQAARTRVVTAREEERRRLRRDLHDGLGSVLSGIGFKADAARNYVRARPDEAVELLTQLRAESAAALTDVRRLVYGLRPPVLDDSGLVDALQRHAERLASHGGDPLTVTVDAPPVLPPLPAAVEVAAYRIAAEALTNVARHAHATSVTLLIRVGELLTVTVLDDGGPPGEAWAPGVGIVGMRERAAELGGSLRAGPGTRGGEVCLTLPLRPAVVDPAGTPRVDATRDPAVTA
jgi:signal transduction histidine kinase